MPTYTKKNKLMFIVQEFEKRADRYNINGIDTSRAKYFARKHQGMFEEIPLGNYNISRQGNQNYLIITNKEYLATIERLQICYEFASISSDYEVEFEVDVNTLKNKYNQLVTDVKNLFTYVKTNMMTADALDVFNILPQLDADEVWVKTVDGWRGLNIGNLEANIQGLLDEMKNRYNKYMTDIKRIGDGYEKDITHMGDTYKKEMTQIKNDNYAEINGLGTQFKSDIQAMGEMYLGNIAGSFEREVLQGKADIDKHTDDKLEVLDSTTALKVQELENKKVVCIQELNNTTSLKKTELEDYEKTLEEELAKYPVMKKEELDAYVNATSKPQIDTYTADKIVELNDYTEEKKVVLNAHTEVKKSELDAYNKTNIGKYDTEIRDGLNMYQMYLVNEMDSHAKEVTAPKVNEIVQAGIESARSQVDGEVAKITAEGTKQVQAVTTEGNKQVSLVRTEGDLQIKRIQETSLDGKQDKEDTSLQTSSSSIVGAINELNSGKQNSTDARLKTDDKTIVGAINELKTKKLDATGGLVSGELDFDTKGDNALRFLADDRPQGYIFPTSKGLRITGTNLKTDGITISNNGDAVIMEKGVTVKDTLKIYDFLEAPHSANIQYHYADAESDEPFKTMTINNVEHLILHDGLSHFRVYTEKNLDINSKFDTTGGELTGDLSIRKAGKRAIHFLEDQGTESAEIACNDDNSFFLTNKKSGKGIGIDTRGKIGLNSTGVLSNNEIHIKGNSNECKFRLTNTENPSNDSVIFKTNDALGIKVNNNIYNYMYDDGRLTIKANNLNTSSKDLVTAINEVNTKAKLVDNKLDKTGGTIKGSLNVTGVLGTSVANASAIQAVRGDYTAMFGCSSTLGDFVFGGKPNSKGDYESYIRLSNSKCRYHNTSGEYDILTSKGGYTMNGGLTIGTNSAKSKLRVVSGSDAVALVVPNDESNYITFVKNNASSSVRKAWFGFGDANTSTMTMRNDVSGKQVAISTNVSVNSDLKVTDGHIEVATSGKTFRAYHNYGYMCGADSSNTQVYAMYGYNNVLNIGYNNQFPTVKFNANEVVAQSNISCNSITINGWKLTITG